MANKPNKLKDLKRRLNKELQKANSDNTIILSLSQQIAELDKNQIKFSVDAGIIHRLGKELVGRHETAVSELVKNAYDADACEVTLTFENTYQEGGTLFIDDNGIGMNRDQLINGFMRLSSSDKIHNPISPRYKRIRAGKKGIGRFAAQRLGEKLTIITQTIDTKQAFKIYIDWKDFEKDKDLLLIANSIEKLPKEKKEGTTLIIEKLREVWSDAAIRRAYRYTSELLQPFPLSKHDKDGNDPGFHSVYYRKNEDKLHRIADEEVAFFDNAAWQRLKVLYHMKDKGQGYWSLKSDKLNFSKKKYLIGKDRENKKNKFKYIRNICFKCYYFILEPKLLSPKSPNVIGGLTWLLIN
ncbi:MAG: ATP-binding protein [Spirochaetales bacterium]|nr:ATP-binding protein [Spirochaetales bacterium]